MTTPPTPTVEAIRGLVEALEAAAGDVADAAVILRRLNYPSSATLADEKAAKARRALARWRERAPLREDAEAVGCVFRVLHNGPMTKDWQELRSAFKERTESAASDILDALDSLLPSPPTRGAP